MARYGFAYRVDDIIAARYRVLRTCGRGGMGIVYEVLDQYLNKRFALKILLADPTERADLVERFSDEAQIGALLDDRDATEEGRHHVMSTVNYGVLEDGRPYAVMPLLTGLTLTEYLVDRAKEEKALPLSEVCQLGCDLYEALCYIHARKVVHRDIKPDNIFLDPSGEGPKAILVDYGIAKVLNPQDGSRRTADGGFPGTLGWAPREQMMGADAHPSMDVYAVALVLFTTLTGQSPWAEYGAEQIRVLLRDPPPKARRFIDCLDRHGNIELLISSILERALSHDPGKRPEPHECLIAWQRALIKARRAEHEGPFELDLNATSEDMRAALTTMLERRQREKKEKEDEQLAKQQPVAGESPAAAAIPLSPQPGLNPTLRSAQPVETRLPPTERELPAPSWTPPNEPSPVDREALTHRPGTEVLPVAERNARRPLVNAAARSLEAPDGPSKNANARPHQLDVMRGATAPLAPIPRAAPTEGPGLAALGVSPQISTSDPVSVPVRRTLSLPDNEGALELNRPALGPRKHARYAVYGLLLAIIVLAPAALLLGRRLGGTAPPAAATLGAPPSAASEIPPPAADASPVSSPAAASISSTPAPQMQPEAVSSSSAGAQASAKAGHTESSASQPGREKQVVQDGTGAKSSPSARPRSKPNKKPLEVSDVPF